MASPVIADSIQNHDGIWWFQAPQPLRWRHRHKPWTSALTEAGWEPERKPRFR